MRTLFVTDLDGTLLNSKSEVSAESARLLQEAIKSGALFSVATARTPATVSRLLKDIPVNLPAIVMTGAVMWIPGTMQYLYPQYINPDTMRQLYEIYCAYNLPVFIYHKPGEIIEVDHYGPMWQAEHDFVTQRQGTPYKRFNNPCTQIPDKLGCYENILLCFSMQQGEVIQRAYEEITQLPGINAVYYHDIFGPDVAMLEVFADTASKANALHRLRQYTHAERVVAFGDNVNDLPLFREADYSIAVENALPELKDAADQVIGTNNTDAVARFIFDEIEDSKK